MTDTWKSFVLPENFKTAEDRSLQDFLRENAGFAVRIDAGKLRRLETLLVELLLCASATWLEAGKSFEVVNLASVNGDVMTVLGVNSNHLNWRVAA
jgi:hypothetical protein